MKTVKGIPSGKFKKIVFPSRNSTNAAIQHRTVHALPTNESSVTSKHVRYVPRFQNFTRLSPSHGEPVQTNGRSESLKSGILIKRNHLKNITVRKINVVQSANKSKDTEDNLKQNGTMSISTEPTTNDSLKNLIADLES